MFPSKKDLVDAAVAAFSFEIPDDVGEAVECGYLAWKARYPEGEINEILKEIPGACGRVREARLELLDILPLVASVEKYVPILAGKGEWRYGKCGDALEDFRPAASLGHDKMLPPYSDFAFIAFSDMGHAMEILDSIESPASRLRRFLANSYAACLAKLYNENAGFCRFDFDRALRGLKGFATRAEWLARLEEIRRNASSLESSGLAEFLAKVRIEYGIRIARSRGRVASIGEAFRAGGGSFVVIYLGKAILSGENGKFERDLEEMFSKEP